MSRGRSDLNETLRQHLQNGRGNYHGNGSVVARACDRFFMDRGLVIDGLRGLMTRQIKHHKAGRLLRESKIDEAALDLEQGWQA